MKRIKFWLKKVLPVLLAIMLIATNVPSLFAAGEGNDPVTVSVNVPSSAKTVGDGGGDAPDLEVELNIQVNADGVTGFTIEIPLEASHGKQYYHFDENLSASAIPDIVEKIEFDNDIVKLTMKDNIASGTSESISIAFVFDQSYRNEPDGTVLWDGVDVSVNVEQPGFSKTLSSAPVVAGEAGASAATGNNVLTGLWQENGAANIEDVYVLDSNKAIIAKTINYAAVLDGTEDTKTLEITLPRELAFKSTAPTSSQIPGIIDEKTVFTNSTSTTGGTLKLVFDKGTTGLVSFDAIVAPNTNYIYSNQNLIIKNSLSAGSTVNTTETSIRIHNYKTQKVCLDPVPGIPPNNVQSFIYSNFPTTFSLVDVYDPEGIYCTVTGTLKSCTLVYDLSKYIAVKDTAGGTFRPLAKGEISIVNSDTCVYDPDTMLLTLKVAYVHNAASYPFVATFNLPAGSTLRLGADATAISGVAYENNFTDIADATFTNFSSYKPMDVPVKALGAEVDIFASRPYTYSTPAQFANYITPNADYESLFTVGATTYQTGFENIRFKVNIPSNATITHIYAQNTAGVVETPVKIYKDASDENPQILSGGINKLAVPISGVTSFEVEYAKFLPNQSIKVGASNNLGLRFFGRVSGSAGDNVTFGIDPASITGVCGDIAETRIPATDMGNNNSFTTVLTDKKYYDVYFYSKQLLKEDKQTLITGVGPVKPGDIVYWGVTIAPDKNINYYSAAKNFYQPVCYFSVPREFLPVNGTFTKDDLYAGLSVAGGPFVPYDVDKLTFEIIPIQGENYNRGNVLIKVTAPEVNLYTNDNNLTTYFSDATVDSLRVFLKIKVDDTIIVTKNVDFHIYGQLVGTAYDKALGAGRGTSNNGIPEGDKIQGIPAGERILFNGDSRSVTITVTASATMTSSVEPKGRTSFVSYDASDPASIPPISAGNYGLYKVTMSNGTPTAIDNAVGYFMFPSGNGWSASIIGALTPTALSITNGVSVFYTTDTGLDGKTLQTQDAANWTALTGATSTAALANATGIKIMVDRLATGERYEAEMPFFAQEVDYKTVSYSQGKGNTSYNMAAASVASGKTAGLELVQSNPPAIVPIDSGYDAQGVKSVSLNDDVSSINANILRAAVADDITGNITEEPFKQYDLPMGLDMAGSTIRNGAGTVMSFADIVASGANPISSSANETYQITYKSYPDHDTQVTTVTRTIIVGTGASPSTSTLSGTITDSVTGEPIPGATVKVTDKDTGTVYTVTTDGDGKYSVPGIPTGDTVVIEVSADGYADKTLPDVTITGDTRQDAQLDPNSGGNTNPPSNTLSGTITDSVTGEPIPGATVKVTDKDTGTVYTVTTDGDGKYSVPGIPTGDTVVIEVSADGYADKTLPDVTITGDTQQDAQLDPETQRLPYVIDFYMGSDSPENLIDEVNGISVYPVGRQLTEADITRDLGEGWLEAKKPDGYDNDNEYYPVITAGNAKNVVKVIYKKLPVYQYRVDYFKDAISTDNLLGSAAGISSFKAGYPLTAADIHGDLGDNWIDKYIPTGYQHGTVQGNFVVISAGNNTVSVLYMQASGGGSSGGSGGSSGGSGGSSGGSGGSSGGSGGSSGGSGGSSGGSGGSSGDSGGSSGGSGGSGGGSGGSSGGSGGSSGSSGGPSGSSGGSESGKVEEQTYIIEYYKDDISQGNMLGKPVHVGAHYPVGHKISETDLTRDVGRNWANARQPEDCGTGVVEGALPVITADIKNNTVKVLYSTLPVYGYTIEYYNNDTNPDNLIASDGGKSAYPGNHKLNGVELTDDLGEDWVNRHKPNGYTNGVPVGYPIISGSSDNVIKIVYSSRESGDFVKPNPKTGGVNVKVVLCLMVFCCILAALALIWKEKIKKSIKRI